MTVAKNNRGRSSKDRATPFPLSPDVVSTADPATQHQAAPHEDAGSVSSDFARQVRMAYGLLQAAIEEAAGTAECSQVQVAAELEYMQKRAIRSMRESALADNRLVRKL